MSLEINKIGEKIFERDFIVSLSFHKETKHFFVNFSKDKIEGKDKELKTLRHYYISILISENEAKHISEDLGILIEQ